MFQKLVAIEPVSLVLSAEKALYSFADEVVMYSDIPAGDNEIIARIGDADAVLLSYTSQINRYILGTFIKYYKISQLIHTQSIAN